MTTLLMVGVSIGNINKKPTLHFSHNNERRLTAGVARLYQRMVLLGVPLMAWKIPTESDRGLLGLSSTGFIWKTGSHIILNSLLKHTHINACVWIKPEKLQQQKEGYHPICSGQQREKRRGGGVSQRAGAEEQTNKFCLHVCPKYWSHQVQFPLWAWSLSLSTCSCMMVDSSRVRSL